MSGRDERKGEDGMGDEDEKLSATGAFSETVRTLFWALLIAFACRTFFFEPFSIPSGSMKPTLLVGDYIFVSKFSYGYGPYSFPFSPVDFDGRIVGSEPERGDVAVFRNPNDDSVDFVKRVVGLPGDEIQVLSGILHINGEPVVRRRIDDFEDEVDGRPSGHRLRQYVETLPNGRQHLILEASDAQHMDNTPVYRVPEGHYFMMGDNRDNSRDSRYLNGVGYIPVENYIGPASIIFFSFDGSAALWEVWKWPFAIRYDRLFDSID